MPPKGYKGKKGEGKALVPQVLEPVNSEPAQLEVDNTTNVKPKKKKKSLMFEPYSAKRRINVFAKSIDPHQPAEFELADIGQNFSLSLNFLHVAFTGHSLPLLSRLFHKMNFMYP